MITNTYPNYTKEDDLKLYNLPLEKLAAISNKITAENAVRIASTARKVNITMRKLIATSF